MLIRTNEPKVKKLISDLWPNESLHQVYLCKSLCWKEAFMIHSAFLQNSCSRSRTLSLIVRQHHRVCQSHPPWLLCAEPCQPHSIPPNWGGPSCHRGQKFSPVTV